MKFQRHPWLASLLIALSAQSLCAQQKTITARQVIERIQSQVGIPWQVDTVDTFKSGDPDTPVTGIAVTMMATLDVLKRAAAAHQNLIITHEPTFFDHLDKATDLAGGEDDPVLREKREFIQKHGLVIWRFHDHWHMRKPDGIQAGVVHALQWEKFQDPANEHLFTLPSLTLRDLAEELKTKLHVKVMRVVGDPNLRVTRVAFSPGASGFEHESRALEMNDVETLIIGETREWETVEYVADAVTEGRHKSLVILGHIASEQAGMEECARWLEGFITEVPIDFVPAREPFWTPDAMAEKMPSGGN
jgi:putative NIF3 family GTP cyclohydrolase 1 type 2